MKTKVKPSVQERIDNLEYVDQGDLIELHSLGVRATFYKSHFNALCRHFFDIEKDYCKAKAGNKIVRTNQGYMRKLFEKTLKRIHSGHQRSRLSYVRWMAVATATWLNVYLDERDVVETVIDHFFNLGDDELTAEITQRSRQMVLWQFYCVKTFSDRVDYLDYVDDEEETDVS